jgi:hypothetical protein
MADLYIKQLDGDQQQVIRLFHFVSESPYVDALDWFTWNDPIIQACYVKCQLTTSMCKYLRRKKDVSAKIYERLLHSLQFLMECETTEEAMKTLSLLETPNVAFTEVMMDALITEDLMLPSFEKLCLTCLLLQLSTKDNSAVRKLMKKNMRLLELQMAGRCEVLMAKLISLV